MIFLMVNILDVTKYKFLMVDLVIIEAFFNWVLAVLVSLWYITTVIWIGFLLGMEGVVVMITM